ncbi:MAG: hypothetical protein NW214_08230 [Pseudanabaenaceae cyanobacterium bins.39]|nr:hypothetical protein [Pseudanabaenaceae cyanobacterium bins.39]
MNTSIHTAISPSTNTLVKRLENMRNSLSNRLEVAKASHNSALVELIEQEQKQIEAVWLKDEPKKGFANLQSLWQRLFQERHELEVWTSNDMSHVWWHAHNNVTGQSVVTDSEDEMRLWIESNYWKN